MEFVFLVGFCNTGIEQLMRFVPCAQPLCADQCCYQPCGGIQRCQRAPAIISERRFNFLRLRLRGESELLQALVQRTDKFIRTGPLAPALRRNLRSMDVQLP